MNPNCRKRMGAIRLENMKVIVQEEIAPAIFELVLEGEMVEAMKAGQFLHLRVPDDAHLLRRPISISSIDKSKKQCHLMQAFPLSKLPTIPVFPKCSTAA